MDLCSLALVVGVFTMVYTLIATPCIKRIGQHTKQTQTPIYATLNLDDFIGEKIHALTDIMRQS